LNTFIFNVSAAACVARPGGHITITRIVAIARPMKYLRMVMIVPFFLIFFKMKTGKAPKGYSNSLGAFIVYRFEESFSQIPQRVRSRLINGS